MRSYVRIFAMFYCSSSFEALANDRGHWRIPVKTVVAKFKKKAGIVDLMARPSLPLGLRIGYAR